MATPFPLHFAGGRTAKALHEGQLSELPAALTALGLQAPRPVMVLVGAPGGSIQPTSIVSARCSGRASSRC